MARKKIVRKETNFIEDYEKNKQWREYQNRIKLKKRRIRLNHKKKIEKEKQRIQALYDEAAGREEEIILDFIRRYGENTYNKYRKDKMLPANVEEKDIELLEVIFNSKAFIRECNLTCMTTNPKYVMILNKLSNYGDVELIKEGYKRFYICNDIRFVMRPFLQKKNPPRRAKFREVTLDPSLEIDCVLGWVDDRIVVVTVGEDRKKYLYFKEEDFMSIEDLF